MTCFLCGVLKSDNFLVNMYDRFLGHMYDFLVHMYDKFLVPFFFYSAEHNKFCW